MNLNVNINKNDNFLSFKFEIKFIELSSYSRKYF